jgi:hypothetical protein
MKRAKACIMTPNRKVVTCIACSWWAPIMRKDISSVDKEFDAHVCADHPPLKNTEKSSQ